jgi:hydrogenase nickel incorporation protein HypA/HybF
MHEFSIITGIIDALIKELERLENEEGKVIEKVNEVILDIGALTFLGKEQLEFCYNIIAEGNRLAGSKLIMNTVPGEVKCTSCDYQGPIEYYREFHLETPILACPECNQPVEITRGQECGIRSMNLEIPDE